MAMDYVISFHTVWHLFICAQDKIVTGIRYIRHNGKRASSKFFQSLFHAKRTFDRLCFLLLSDVWRSSKNFVLFKTCISFLKFDF